MVSDEVCVLIDEAKHLAREYYRLTGRPLGITGEVAEVEAVRLLGLELADVRQAGYDATRLRPDGSVERVQIKGRCYGRGAPAGQRVGAIQLDKPWDVVLLVLMNEILEVEEIYEAGRDNLTDAILKPGSVARNERGALGVAAFKRIGQRIWPLSTGTMPQDRTTGAAGNAFGHNTAPRVAASIGASMRGVGSNEADLDGQRVVVKCARLATSSVGVTRTMLERLDAVVAAFQRPDGRYDVIVMPASIYRAQMRPSRSSAGDRVGIVTRRQFHTHGKVLRTVRV